VEIRFSELHVETEVFADLSRNLPNIGRAIRDPVEVRGCLPLTPFPPIAHTSSLLSPDHGWHGSWWVGVAFQLTYSQLLSQARTLQGLLHCTQHPMHGQVGGVMRQVHANNGPTAAPFGHELRTGEASASVAMTVRSSEVQAWQLAFAWKLS